MIIRKYLQWCETAGARDRARAAGALGRAYALDMLPCDSVTAAEAAMTILLDDPSPLVRLALAEAIATSPRPPRAVIHALARDRLDIAGLIVSCSPVLTASDLVDLAADSGPGVRRAIAMRRGMCVAVSAALAEVGESMAVVELLNNTAANIAGVTLRRIMERHGDCGDVRASLMARADLPADVRHALIVEVGNVLSDAPFITRVVGDSRIRVVTGDACRTATLELASAIGSRETLALVEHLRLVGKLTPAFLMHSLCVGNVEFFAAAIASISGVGNDRVQAVLVDGKRNSMEALYHSAGIDARICGVFVEATLLWRRVARSGSDSDALEITSQLMQIHALNEDKAVRDLMSLVEKLNLSFHRQAARDHAAALVRRAA